MLNQSMKTSILRDGQCFHMPRYKICLCVLSGKMEKRAEYWKMIMDILIGAVRQSVFDTIEKGRRAVSEINHGQVTSQEY